MKKEKEFCHIHKKDLTKMWDEDTKQCPVCVGSEKVVTSDARDFLRYATMFNTSAPTYVDIGQGDTLSVNGSISSGVAIRQTLEALETRINQAYSPHEPCDCGDPECPYNTISED